MHSVLGSFPFEGMPGARHARGPSLTCMSMLACRLVFTSTGASHCKPPPGTPCGQRAAYLQHCAQKRMTFPATVTLAAFMWIGQHLLFLKYVRASLKSTVQPST